MSQLSPGFITMVIDVALSMALRGRYHLSRFCHARKPLPGPALFTMVFAVSLVTLASTCARTELSALASGYLSSRSMSSTS
eukprot:7639437-Heterocapsa_arctica.AAC.1